MKYIVEMVVPYTHESYRWKQILLSDDLGYIKKWIGERENFRVLDLKNLKEVYRTAPESHFGLLHICSNYK